MPYYANRGAALLAIARGLLPATYASAAELEVVYLNRRHHWLPYAEARVTRRLRTKIARRLNVLYGPLLPECSQQF